MAYKLVAEGGDSYNEVTLIVASQQSGVDLALGVHMDAIQARRLIEDISNALGIESRFEKAIPAIEQVLRERQPELAEKTEGNIIRGIEYASYSFLMDELTDAGLVLLFKIHFDYQDEWFWVQPLQFEHIQQANAVFEPITGLLIFIKEEQS